MNLRDVQGLTMSVKAAGLTAGTTSTYTTTATTECMIGGKWATGLAAQTNTASPTTDARTGAAFTAITDNQATVLVWGVTAAGAIAVCQGGIEDTEVGITTTAGAFKNAPQFPPLPDNFCPIGYSLHRTAPSAATWTPGTSSWAATGVTSLFVEVAVLPDRPQIA